jgi:protein tyrosine kinase modulator
MLPGKAYKPEDYLRMVWHRKWFVVVPTVLIATGTYFWSASLPNRYSSATTIAVVPQRVPTSFVKPTVSKNVGQRLNSIQQEILSRSRLERLIEEFKLYPEERKTLIMEDIVESMRRRDIKVRMARRNRGDSPDSFTVAFEYTQPRVAMQVAERLGSMFVQANLQEREVLADSTSQFLDSQLEDSRRRLAEHEQKLAEFRKQHFGQLPGQMQSNLQMLQVTQNQIQANTDATNRDRDRLAGIENQIGGVASGAIAVGDDPEESSTPTESTEAAGTAAKPGEAGEGRKAQTATQQLANAKANLKGLELRLKPTHPDVIRAKRTIEELEVRAAEEAKNGGGNPAARLSPARLANLQKEADQLRRSLERRRVEDERLRSTLAQYKERIEISPKLDTELTELNRGYDTIRHQYDALLKKSEDAKMAATLERRQIGEQFKVVESARLPERPVSPDRMRMNMMGLGAGLVLGLALIGLLEYRDTTMKTDDDILVSLALPVLAVIPTMVTSIDRRRRKRRRVLAALTASAVIVLGAAAVAAWRLHLLQAWVR